MTLNNEKSTQDFKLLKNELNYVEGNYWYEDEQVDMGIVTFKGTLFNIALLLLIKNIADEGEKYQSNDKHSLITDPNIEKVIEQFNRNESLLGTVAVYLEKNEKTIEELTAYQKSMQSVPKSLKNK